MSQRSVRKSLNLKIALNTFSQALGRVLSGVAGFTISLLVAKNFGAEGFGDFIKITSFVAAFYLLADFGLNAIYLNQAADEKEVSVSKQWSRLFILRLMLGLFLVFVALATLTILPMGRSDGYTKLVRFGIIIFSPTIIFQAVITSANAYFQKKLRYDLATTATLGGSFFSLALIWWLSSLSNLSSAFILIIVFLGLGSLTTAVLSLVFVRKFKVTLYNHHTFRQMFGLLRQSIPLGITLIFNLFYFRVDSFILTITRSTAEVGIYGLAYKIFELPLAFATFFMNSVYPLMLENLKTEKKRISSNFLTIVKKAFIVLFSSSLVLTAIIFIASPMVMQIRPDFASSSSALRILSLSLPVFFITSLLMWILIALKRQTTLMFIYGLAMMVNVVLNLFLVPRFGYVAAAWITLASEALVLFLSAMAVYKLIREDRF